MCILLVLVLSAVLGCTGAVPHHVNIETLMDNVVVLRMPHAQGTMVNVPLTCGEAYENEAVFWKKNGVEMEPPLQGNKVTVVVEEMRGGNYTCHLSPGGEYLNHTEILIQLDGASDPVILQNLSSEEGFVHCSAQNYKGSFHCAWTRTESRSNAAVLLVAAERYMQNIPCELDADGSGVHCQDTHCPFDEEKHRIAFTVYMRSAARLEAYKKSFYLREIVRPATIPNLSIHDGNEFRWDYPASWEKPCTYFGLQFEVKVVQNAQSCTSEAAIVSNITTDTAYKTNVRAKRFVFCVRAQDKNTLGPWSQWSQCVVNKNHVSC
ncbi:interleukin-12 subunit beta [Mugil cephalus]|uniref:interleukin-12 subunit beta n=1 Tax=Mugil cephalus TaxID=48193 RepID=UPI001FB7DCA6|nr:interleukin-12 subunit beta [Mugil cephalus]